MFFVERIYIYEITLLAAISVPLSICIFEIIEAEATSLPNPPEPIINNLLISQGIQNLKQNNLHQ
jgi:hypothetical protein